MKLFDAVQEAKEAGYTYIAIDADGEIYCYSVKPSTLPNHQAWGFWGVEYSADVCMFLGKFEYVVGKNYETHIFDINDLTLRGC